MQAYQQKLFNAAREDQLLSLERGLPPTLNELIQLAEDMANLRGLEKIQTVERDPATLEIVSTVTVEAPTAERFGYMLGGRIQALLDFYDAATKAGVKLNLK